MRQRVQDVILTNLERNANVICSGCGEENIVCKYFNRCLYMCSFWSFGFIHLLSKMYHTEMVRLLKNLTSSRFITLFNKNINSLTLKVVTYPNYKPFILPALRLSKLREFSTLHGIDLITEYCLQHWNKLVVQQERTDLLSTVALSGRIAFMYMVKFLAFISEQYLAL
jgi:hypothetical protein